MTGDQTEIPAAVFVHAKGMKESLHLATSLDEATASEVEKRSARLAVGFARGGPRRDGRGGWQRGPASQGGLSKRRGEGEVSAALVADLRPLADALNDRRLADAQMGPGLGGAKRTGRRGGGLDVGARQGRWS